MASVRCSVCNKFYNPEKFIFCPFCDREESEKTNGSIGTEDLEEKETESDARIDDILNEVLSARNNGDGKTVSFFGGGVSSGTYNSGESQEKDVENEEKSETILGASTERAAFRDQSDSDVGMQQELPVQNSVAATDVNDSDLPQSADSDRVEKRTSEIPNDDLVQKLEAAKKQDNGKTWGYFQSLKSSLHEASASESNDERIGETISRPSSPVVGWLVCTGGAHFGESFSFGEGYNSIGRLPSNNIALSKDQSVSREECAFVVFDAKTNGYFLQACQGKSLVHLNGEPLFDTKAIKSYDVIEIGDERLMLIALCGERFNWKSILCGEEQL